MPRRTEIAMILTFALGALVVVDLRPSRTAETIAHGCFHTVTHKGSGCAEIRVGKDRTRSLELSNLEVDGPNLEILLSSAPDAFENSFVESVETVAVGEINVDHGYQSVPLPDELDVSRFHSVTIWNRKYQVNHSTAPLR